MVVQLCELYSLKEQTVMARELYLRKAVEDVKVAINLYFQKTHSGQDLLVGP